MRGYGFITPLIGKPDTVERVFFHISAMRSGGPGRPGAPPVGAEVRFRLVRGVKGQAADVELVEISGKTLNAASERQATPATTTSCIMR